MNRDCNETLVTMAKSKKLGAIQPGKHVLLDNIPPLTIENINDPLQRSRKSYFRMGCPTRDEMKAIVARQENNSYYGISVTDVDLLPWNDVEGTHSKLTDLDFKLTEQDRGSGSSEEEIYKHTELKARGIKLERERKKSEKSRASVVRRQTSSYIPQPGESLTVNPFGTLASKSFDMIYKLGDVINEGSFGIVYRAHHVLSKPEDIVAAKVVCRKSEKADQDVINEASLLKDINHLPNVTRLIDFYMDKKKLYVIQELARGGDVFDRLIEREIYTEEDARMLAKNLLMTMESLHDLGLVHRDLKPENLLLKNSYDDTDILLCDFGYASYLPKDGSGLWRRCGTPAFASPEIINGEEYWTEIDMWSVGCIIFMLLCGQMPFDPDDDDIYEYISTADYDLDDPMWDVISEEAKEIIFNLLLVDQKQRFTAREALQSAWFINCTEEELESIDLTDSLDGIKNYCENIRTEEIRRHFSQYNDSKYVKSSSSSDVPSETELPSDTETISSEDSLDVLDYTPRIEVGNLPCFDISENSISFRGEEEEYSRGEQGIKASEIAKKRFEESYEKFSRSFNKETEQIEEFDENEVLRRKQDNLKIEQLRQRMSKLKEKQQLPMGSQHERSRVPKIM